MRFNLQPHGPQSKPCWRDFLSNLLVPDSSIIVGGSTGINRLLNHILDSPVNATQAPKAFISFHFKLESSGPMDRKWKSSIGWKKSICNLSNISPPSSSVVVVWWSTTTKTRLCCVSCCNLDTQEYLINCEGYKYLSLRIEKIYRKTQRPSFILQKHYKAEIRS